MKPCSPDYFPVMGWEETPDGVTIFEVISKEFPLDSHHPAIDFASGKVDCGCLDFETRIAPICRKENRIASINRPKDQCKHIWQAIGAYMRASFREIRAS